MRKTDEAEEVEINIQVSDFKCKYTHKLSEAAKEHVYKQVEKSLMAIMESDDVFPRSEVLRRVHKMIGSYVDHAVYRIMHEEAIADKVDNAIRTALKKSFNI